jgi:hypothetical protein
VLGLVLGPLVVPDDVAPGLVVIPDAVPSPASLLMPLVVPDVVPEFNPGPVLYEVAGEVFDEKPDVDDGAPQFHEPKLPVELVPGATDHGAVPVVEKFCVAGADVAVAFVKPDPAGAETDPGEVKTPVEVAGAEVCAKAIPPNPRPQITASISFVLIISSLLIQPILRQNLP